MLNLEEFRQTGRDCDDLGSALSTDFGHDEPTRGRIYVDCLYIEQMRDGRWTLIIGRCEWIESLPQLERRLYEFARSEGYLD
jgi:hypothetical protein